MNNDTLNKNSLIEKFDQVALAKAKAAAMEIEKKGRIQAAANQALASGRCESKWRLGMGSMGISIL